MARYDLVIRGGTVGCVAGRFVADVAVKDGRMVGEHPRCFGREQTIYDPWHYVPVLARKPGALRNGAPFKDWVLPGAIDRVRRKLAAVQDGDRQMVEILTAVLSVNDLAL